MAITLENLKTLPSSLPRKSVQGSEKKRMSPWQEAPPFNEQIDSSEITLLIGQHENQVAKGEQPGSNQVANADSPALLKQRQPADKNNGAHTEPGSNQVAETELAYIDSPIQQTKKQRKWNENQVAKGEQPGSNQVAKRVAGQVAKGEQPGSNQVAEEISRLEPGSNQVAKRVAGQVAKGEQPGSNQVAETDFRTLVGKEFLFLQFVFIECKISGATETPPLTMERMANVLQVTKNRAKNVIKRVLKKGFIERLSGKACRGGWSRFALKKEVFNRMILTEPGSNQVAKGEQPGSNQVAKQVAKQVAEASISSSIDLNKANTTDKDDLPMEWQDIDISPLASIDFEQQHLVDIFKNSSKPGNSKITPEQVQSSIYQFAFDLEHGHLANDIKKNPRSALIGILIKRGPYSAKGAYKNPQVEHLEVWKKKRAEELAAIRKIEDEIRELQFFEWERRLTKEARQQLLQELKMPKDASTTSQKAYLENHFYDVVWLTMKDEVLAEILKGEGGLR